MSGKKLLYLGICWSLFIWVVVIGASRFLPFEPSYPYAEQIHAFGPSWMVRLAGFDGVHYLRIVQDGYKNTGLIQAFFPGYPLLVRALNIVGNPVLTGLIVSTCFFFLGLLMLGRLLTLDRPVSSSYETRIFALLLTFPSAFFFLGMYSESLFLFLSLVSFWGVRTKHIGVAVLAEGIASATRLVGIVLIPALLLEAYLTRKEKGRGSNSLKTGLLILFGSIGLLVYMRYLQVNFGDALYFLHVQEEFGGGRQESFVLFPQVVYRYIKIFISAKELTWSYFAFAQELYISLAVGLLLVWGTVKKAVRPSYLLYAWVSFLIPPLTGTFQSMPRYMLTVFPLFLIASRWLESRRRFRTCLIVVHAILLLINIVLFTQGKWVS